MKTSVGQFAIALLATVLLGCGRAPDPVAEKAKPAPPAAAADTTDWPMFRGNPHLTGVAAGSLPEKLKLRWRFKAEDAVESSAAIVTDTVYVGSNSNALHALDLATGKQRWLY
ncbi:MAG: PQQ-binding-like beta-propeller repeat protein, partial [Verrucomicrobia bacterium]|nr:PQQ-binding-like beta-propeller repeat protein [Verrucomicrobiota bacterium]